MANIEKLRLELAQTIEKIAVLQARKKALEVKVTEAENLEIVQLVKAVKMTNQELTTFLRAYASGQIVLPDNLMEADIAAQAAEADGHEA